jgi:imidazolonepropionase-like amidohydrolase
MVTLVTFPPKFRSFPKSLLTIVVMKKLYTLFAFPLILSVIFFLRTDELARESNNEFRADAPIAFVNVSVLPMTEKGLILENQTVMIKEDRITMVGPSDNMELSDGVTIIDGRGKYLMPGLAEMHGHVPPTHPPTNAPSYFDEDYVKSTLFLYVAAGITTVRGMLGYDHQLELKDKVNSGEYIGPNLYLAGPSFNGNTVSSPEQAKERVIQQQEEGWDLLKIHPGLTLEEYNAVAETANEIGITFGGHVPEAVGIERAIEAGQLTMDHIDGYVAYLEAFEGAERDQKMGEIIQKTLENNVWIVPTQALWETIIGAADYDAMKDYDELKYIPRQVEQNYLNFVDNLENNAYYDPDNAMGHAMLRQRLLSEMNKAGVKILMGTDAPQLFSVPGFSIHRELPKMEEAGMTSYEILETGTKNVGEYFKDEDSFGTIQLGQRADLILVNGNPLEDLNVIKDHSGVMVRGEWIPRGTIDEHLSEIENMYRN